MKKVFFSFLLLSVIFFSSALSAIESVKVVPDDAFGFIAVNFQFDGFMDKILTLQEKYTDDDFMRAITQMKETFGFSPMEKKFLKNFNSTTFILLKSEDLKRNPRVGVIVDLKDPDLFKQYLDKLKTNVKNKKDISVYPCTVAKFPVTIFEKKGKDKEVLYTAFFNNIFAVGIGKDEGLQVLVDLQERAARNSFSIDKNKSFQKLVSHFPINSPIYAYMSGEMAKADMSYELPSIAKTDNLIEGSAISINYQDGTISSDGYVLFKESKNNPLNIYLKSNTQPLKSSTILPEGTLLYLAGRFMIPQEVFKKIEFADAISKINNGLGVDFQKDIYPWLGSELFISISNYHIVPTPPFETPAIYLGIGVKNEKDALDAMEKVEAAYKLRSPNNVFKGEKVGGIKYRHIEVPTGGMLKDFSLSYFVKDNFLIFTTGRAAIDSISKVSSKKLKPLSQSKDFLDNCGTNGIGSLMTGFLSGRYLSDLAIKFMEMENTPEKDMEDIRSLQLIKGAALKVSNDNSGVSFRASIKIDIDLLNKMSGIE